VTGTCAPRPLKHVRYPWKPEDRTHEHTQFPPAQRKQSFQPKAMTTCIAAACRSSLRESCIVLCSDTRVDYADLGSINTAIKIDALGHNWCAQMAGDWGNVIHWKDHLKRRIQTPKAASVERVGRCIKESADYFMNSVFCEPGRVYELLLSGFSNEEPVIIAARIEPLEAGSHALRVTVSYSFACIGSGSVISNALLTARECHAQMPLEYVSYLVYEAKRGSEKSGGVGEVTVLLIHGSGVGAEETVDKASVMMLNEAGHKHFARLYWEIWKPEFATFPKLPKEFWVRPAAWTLDPESTTLDFPRQPPSQE
jgi:hypothetical protein